MMHTEYDNQAFEYWLLLLPGAAVAGVYGLLVAIGLVARFFRSRRVLRVSFVLSALASLPLLWVMITQWEILPRHWDRGGAGPLTLFLLNLVPLCFVWLAPAVQHLKLRRSNDERSEQPDAR